MVFKPTQQELAEAAKLGVNPAGLNGPALRKAIARAKLRQKAKLDAMKQYRAWVDRCRALGIQVPGGKNSPPLKDLIQLYINRLPLALAERGIVEGATLTIPPQSKLSRAGKAKVRMVWPATRDRISITLDFGDERKVYDVFLVYLEATVIRPPQSSD